MPEGKKVVMTQRRGRMNKATVGEGPGPCGGDRVGDQIISCSFFLAIRSKEKVRSINSIRMTR